MTLVLRRGSAAALAVAFATLFGWLALASAPAVLAAPTSPSPGPSFVAGKHVYDDGHMLSAKSSQLAEKLAARIEGAGGGRIVVYTAESWSDLPPEREMLKNWSIDGMLIQASASTSGQRTLGATLKTKLGDAADVTEGSPGMQTTESWILSSLARTDAILSGKHVFDGTGILDATSLAAAEKATQDLSQSLGIPVYVDISLGGDDPGNASFFNGAHLNSVFDGAMVIALSVSDSHLGGYLSRPVEAWDKYNISAPWDTSSFESQAAPGGDVQAALLADIRAIQPKSAVENFVNSEVGGLVLTLGIIALCFVLAIFGGPFLIRKLAGVSGPIEGGLPATATITSVTETGVTVTMPSVGPDAPKYKLGLSVTPPGGGQDYPVEIQALIPRVFVPMILPGNRIAVQVDPKDPRKVVPDWERTGSGEASADGTGTSGFQQVSGMTGALALGQMGGTMSVDGVNVAFDSSGRPVSGLDAMVGAVRSGKVNSEYGSAASLLATGTHGTAVVTSCQPLGKKVRDLDPKAEASKADDPIWLFTLDVTLPGRSAYPAMFGHRVPLAKLASIGPGTRLAVAVDESNPTAEVAIDWDRSPLP